MRTIALRFGDNFAPPEGTIAAHQAVIDEHCAVWWGKLGNVVAQGNVNAVLSADDPMILLIHSGRQDRWWAHIDRAQRERPKDDLIPSYYAQVIDKFHCWFRVKSFERAEDDVMTKCVVPSSGRILSSASRRSMSPFFVIDYEE